LLPTRKGENKDAFFLSSPFLEGDIGRFFGFSQNYSGKYNLFGEIKFVLPVFITKPLARLWYTLDRRHRLITLRNLEFALGRQFTREQRQQLALEVFHHFVKLFFEAVAAILLPLSQLKKRVIVIGQEHGEAALKLGKGALAIAAHAGNWELTCTVYGLGIHPMSIVARKHANPLMDRLIRYIRERGGNTMIPKQGGLKAILRQLKKNQIVGMAIDQNTTTKGGILVDFFGHRARTTPIAAILARRFGVPVLTVLSRRLPDGRHLMVISPPLPMEITDNPEEDIRRHVQLQSDAVEAWVRASPEQWLWLHKRWKNQYPELYRNL
jgi:KDO2-lipid IV(A) lauroyltransferase